MKKIDALLRRLKQLPLLTQLWWGAGLALILGYAFFSSLAADSCLAILFAVFLWMWMVSTAVYALFWLWRKLTYRIGVRLFFSYLLIGVLPFPLLLALLGIAGYVLTGQYASAELADVARRVSGEMVDFASEAAAVAEREGAAAARRRLERGPRMADDLRFIAEHVEWAYASDDGVRHRSGAVLEAPAWVSEGVEAGPFRTDAGPVLAAIARRGEHVVAAYVLLTEAASRAFSKEQWYQVIFLEEEARVTEDGVQLKSPPGQWRDEEAETAEAPEAEIGTGVEEARAEEDAGFWRSLWQRRWIWNFRVSPELRRWDDGTIIPETAQATLVRTSPQAVAADLFRSPYEYQQKLLGVFLAICFFFALVYLGVVGMAGYSIWAITRSTARLTRGTRQVQAGHLHYRIPVKRRDQLGDLAVAFNGMTESVAGMLDEVAEKERLKGELELAREIQQSLLPASRLEHGPISVHAYFRPAAEVGGDYFDLFPLERGRLIVAAGDVAGHGLSTGLLMAMVKSAVATLVHEGHRGRELLERVNRFMLEQPREHRMVTLAIADVDAEAGVAEITNAAHPPVYLSRGTVQEVMLPALPVGYQWRRPPPSKKLDLEPGSRLVFYSDGLVEAVDGDGEQFGYERLRAFLQEHAEAASEELLARLLAELERYTGGRPLDDDLTVLVIDCGAAQGVSVPSPSSLNAEAGAGRPK